MTRKYKYIKIGIASPEEILSWSHGEVTSHETINYRTSKPEPNGLFCERIFGPTHDFRCYCGTDRKNKNEIGTICPKCGVEITKKSVRRERMGHIQLATPVVHTWFLKSTPSPIALLLDFKNKDLENIVYLASFVVINPGSTGLKYKEIISEQDYEKYRLKDPLFEAQTGAEVIKRLLSELDLKKEEQVLRRQLREKKGNKQGRDYIIKRLEIVESFINSNNKPEWMVLTVLPVLPPDLRPMVQLDGGRNATSSLNDLYIRIINRNERLKKQIEAHAPAIMTKNEKRMLQEAVDALIDTPKRNKKSNDKSAHSKSLSDFLRGKQGRFRQNLLGKRVDYSGRSVIVVGPNLKMYQCGIPREMALKLFQPFVLHEILKKYSDITIKGAENLCNQQDERALELLEKVVREHPVLLNRAPTLHRLGIQAFEPVLIAGKAIRLHPLVCTAFNADFDGDQMAVHVPISLEAQAEARLLMLASNNILNPKDGKPVVTPSQDMVLGNYYLTLEKVGLPNEGHFYKDYEEAYLAYKNHEITLHTRIFVDPSYLPEARYVNNKQGKCYLFTTVGKMIFNSIIPDDFPYLNESTDDNLTNRLPEKYLFCPKTDKYEDFLAYPVVDPFKKKFLARIIAEVFKKYQINETSKMLDKLKDQGFHYSTKSGITISMDNILNYEPKKEYVAGVEENVEKVEKFYDLGLFTGKEKKKKVEELWSEARTYLEKAVWKELQKQPDNPIFMMADSGSRGSTSNFSQLAGMRGLMSNTAGETIEVPVKSNFREGLTVSEFFISTHGSRKGSTDTALKTAESGYLTRRLVDVSQDIIISTEDCGTEKGMWIEDVILDKEGKKRLEAHNRVIGRYAAADIVTENGEVLCKRNELIDEMVANKIKENGITRIYVRTNLTCNCKTGVCMKCYGRNLATNKIVEVGESVGVVAAQSIGEPGTQLTMRTFHNGGVASDEDITQGLPRVQELFEARNPKGKATISENDGKVVNIDKNTFTITIENDNPELGEPQSYVLDATAEILVNVGDHVKRGDRLNRGPISPKELLRVKDTESVQKYIVEEVQKVYNSQSVEISDKHIEIIVHQMLRKILVIHEGSTNLLPGREVSVDEFRNAVNQAFVTNGELPKGKPVLLGITKAALASPSFLSASSFQETTKVLTQAAIRSKTDSLDGLKENVIIGGLIPAGTGILQEEEFSCLHKPAEDDYDLLDEEITEDYDDTTTEEELLEETSEEILDEYEDNLDEVIEDFE